jgi:hypothetical protein
MMPAPIITAADLRFSTTSTEQAARGLDTLLVTLITFIRRFVVVTDAGRGHRAVGGPHARHRRL